MEFRCSSLFLSLDWKSLAEARRRRGDAINAGRIFNHGAHERNERKIRRNKAEKIPVCSFTISSFHPLLLSSFLCASWLNRIFFFAYFSAPLRLCVRLVVPWSGGSRSPPDGDGRAPRRKYMGRPATAAGGSGYGCGLTPRMDAHVPGSLWAPGTVWAVWACMGARWGRRGGRPRCPQSFRRPPPALRRR